MEVGASASRASFDGRTRRKYQLFTPCVKRTCLSAESALTGRPNVEDVPLGAKLPMIPGNKLQLYTTNLCEKLHLPSCDFDRTYPSDVYVSNEYRCLHDPHLKRFFVGRPDMRRRLRKNDFITPEHKVVCSLKEYNLYRQYIKHLSIEYLNKKYIEQYEKELEKKKEEKKRKIKEIQQHVDNPINKRIEKARESRRVMEKELEMRRALILRRMRAYTEKRERERKEERLRRMIKEEIREKTRERAKQEKAAKEVEETLMKERLLNMKHKEDLQRRKALEEKLKQEKRNKEKVLIENYQRKKKFHSEKMRELQKLLAEEDMKRKGRVADFERFFSRKHKIMLSALESLKQRDRKARSKRNLEINERLKARGWTGAACRRKSVIPKGDVEDKSDPQKYLGYGDGSKMATAQIVRQLSAMGFHDVMMTPGILKAMLTVDSDTDLERSSGDAAPMRRTLSQQANQFCEEIMKQGYASEYVRHVIEISQELEATSRDIVAQVIDVSRNVLLPMLESYEKKTGVRVTTAEIPETLRELSSGVFDEEEDYLPQIFSFDDVGKTTMHAGTKQSNVRFVVSQSDIPMELRARKRPPTPKKVTFSSISTSSSGSDTVDIGSDSHAVLEETIKQLSEKVVQQVFLDCNLVEPEIGREEMHDRINEMAKSIIDEIILFGTTQDKESSSTQTSSSPSDRSGALLEEKISHLAKQLITDVVQDIKEATKVSGIETQRSSSTSSVRSTESSVSILALRVVTSILGTVDPTTGKTIRDHAAACQGLEERVANLSAKVVEEIIKEKHRKSPTEKIDRQGYFELEEKISKLALSIVTSAIEGKRPGSSTTITSLCSAEVEEKVTELSARIIGGIIKLKELLPKDRKKFDEPEPKPVTSVERILREIFNIEALQYAPASVLQKATVQDVQKISDDIAKRLVPPRGDSSAVSSGLSQLAVAMAENAVIKAGYSNASTVGSFMDDAVDNLADVVVEETLGDQKILSDESKISSAISEVANAVIEEALARGDLTGRVFSSSESKLSSAISEIAQTITENALERNTSQSAVSSGANKLAGAITREVIHKVTDGGIDSTASSAIESGISDVATVAAKDTVQRAQVIDSSTQSAISSEIKNLAERIAQQAMDIAAADPEGFGSSTRSAISSGASQLAAQVAAKLTGQGSISTSTLESVLSSAVSDLVSEMLIRQVLRHIDEQRSDTSSQGLAGEIERMVRGILGSKGESKLSKKMSVETTHQAHGESTSSALESGVSDLASDVVKELLSDKDSRDLACDDGSSSAISAVAARYVHQVLGIPTKVESSTTNQNQANETPIVPAQVVSLAAVPPRQSSEEHGARLNPCSVSVEQIMPRPPKVDKPNGRKVRIQVKGMSTGNVRSINQKPNRRHTTNFASSFTDWRSLKDGGLQGKSLSALKEVEERPLSLGSQTKFAGDLGKIGRTSSEAFDEILENLATRIVSSVAANQENEEVQIGQDLAGSQSVEQLVGTLALGVVTSLLGLDVLNSTSSTDQPQQEARPGGSEDRINGLVEGEAPGPSAGRKIDKSAEMAALIPTESKEAKGDDASRTCPKILGILSSDVENEDWKKSAYTEPCQDDADEHPHRVRSPTMKDRRISRGMRTKELHGKGLQKAMPSFSFKNYDGKSSCKGYHDSLYPRESGWISPKVHRKDSFPRSPTLTFDGSPVKPSAGFLDRRLFTNTKNRRHEGEKPRSTTKHCQTPSPSSNSRRKPSLGTYALL